VSSCAVGMGRSGRIFSFSPETESGKRLSGVHGGMHVSVPDWVDSSAVSVNNPYRLTKMFQCDPKKKAKYVGLRFHDLRRLAYGTCRGRVSRKRRDAISGHRTEAFTAATHHRHGSDKEAIRKSGTQRALNLSCQSQQRKSVWMQNRSVTKL